MKKILLLLLGIISIFSLSNCSKKEPFEFENSKYSVTLVYQHIALSSFINDMELEIKDAKISFYSEYPKETFSNDIGILTFGKIPKKAWEKSSLTSIGKYQDNINADEILEQIKEEKFGYRIQFNGVVDAMYPNIIYFVQCNDDIYMLFSYYGEEVSRIFLLSKV